MQPEASSASSFPCSKSDAGRRGGLETAARTHVIPKAEGQLIGQGRRSAAQRRPRLGSLGSPSRGEIRSPRGQRCAHATSRRVTGRASAYVRACVRRPCVLACAFVCRWYTCDFDVRCCRFASASWPLHQSLPLRCRCFCCCCMSLYSHLGCLDGHLGRSSRSALAVAAASVSHRLSPALQGVSTASRNCICSYGTVLASGWIG